MTTKDNIYNKEDLLIKDTVMEELYFYKKILELLKNYVVI